MVIDKGIGISESDQQKLFKPYFRTNDTNSREMNVSSHGLGLNICYKICKALGGSIKVDSKLGKGSTFTFSFKATRVKKVPT